MRLLTYVCLLIGTVYFGAFLYFSEDREVISGREGLARNSHNKSEGGQSKPSENREKILASGEVSSDDSYEEEDGKKEASQIGSSEIAVLLDFNKSRGFFPSDVKEQYEMYEDEVLRQLSDEGDMLATQTLANRFERKGDIDNAMDLFIKAAAQGSARALIDIKSIWFTEYQMAEHNKDKEHMKKAKLEAYAWNAVLKMRNHSGADQAGKFYKEEAGMTLSTEEKKIVQHNAAQYYRLLKERRSILGYGEFDNSVPEEVSVVRKAIRQRDLP